MRPRNLPGLWREGLQRLEAEIETIFKMLPALRERLSPFREKLRNKGQKTKSPSEETGADRFAPSGHSYLQSDGYPRKTRVHSGRRQVERIQRIVFRFGCSLLRQRVRNGSRVGQPTQDGWKWIRMDELGSEISTGIDMMNNRSLPRFLELPVPMPKRIAQ